jgi:membrane associated rhomboid family serine protease
MITEYHYRNVLGANFALVGSPSLGASGAIFGTVAVRRLRRSQEPWLRLFFSKVTWVDLFAHWKYQYRPVRKVS